MSTRHMVGVVLDEVSEAAEWWASCEHEFDPQQVKEHGDDADCLYGCGTFYGEVI